MPTTTDAAAMLAAIAEQLAGLDYGTDTPTRTAIADDVRDRTWTLPRGVTFTTRDDGGVIYVETHTSRVWHEDERTSTDERTSLDVTVYGTLTRGERVTSGAVEIRHLLLGAYDDETTTHAYFRHLTGAGVPDGARAAVADAVRGAVAGMLTEQGWRTLADETDAARHAADVRRHVGTAIRELTDAAAKIRRAS